MNFEQTRKNMIECQIKPWNVNDQAVLNVLSDIHREDFLPAAYRSLAFADISIALEHGQYTMTPKVEARILQTLKIKATDNILEVGTGCGYLTALLTAFSYHVVSVDIYVEFIQQAQKKLQKYNIENVTLELGDAIHGWQENAPYDVIVVTGSIPHLDNTIQQQLKMNGRLFIVVGKLPIMEAMLITRTEENKWHSEVLFETTLPPLIGTKPTNLFKF
ncbi:Protein-L-isoaspartate O-methyltransferase [uncultured Candidatus Thioglobus sp.]|nr:Protein-L-isoaspartate O-methyltransferase [uncultured Candidatus Thioglobus sp.]